MLLVLVAMMLGSRDPLALAYVPLYSSCSFQPEGDPRKKDGSYYRNGGLKLFASLLYFRSVPTISKSAKDPLSSRCLSHVFSLNSNLVPIPKRNAKAKLT